MSNSKQKAWQLQKGGAIPQAIALYTKAEIEDPNDPEIPFLLASALKRQKLVKPAFEALKRAIALKDDFVEAHNNIGIAYQNDGQLSTAEVHFKKAHELEPKNPNYGINLGGVYQSQGRPTKCCELVYPILKLHPTHALGWNTLGSALLDIGHRTEAAGCFARAHQNDPSNALVLLHLYAATVSTPIKDSEIQLLTEALKRNPHLHMARFLQAEAIHRTDPTRGQRLLSKLQGPQFMAWKDSLDYMVKNANGALKSFADTASTLEYAIEIAKPDGQVLEFGVRFGTSAQILQALSEDTVSGFDSFEGLPTAWHEQPAGAYSTGGQIPELPNIQLIPGWFEDTLPGFVRQNPSPIRLVNIDCDLYSSTKTVLTELTPLFQNGTIIVFDEYLMNPKWREDEYKAFQEWVNSSGWRYRYRAVSYFTNQVVVELTAKNNGL